MAGRCSVLAADPLPVVPRPTQLRADGWVPPADWLAGRAAEDSPDIRAEIVNLLRTHGDSGSFMAKREKFPGARSSVPLLIF
jgi:hypothetical protein